MTIGRYVCDHLINHSTDCYSPGVRELGIFAINSGHVAAVTLAGGQVCLFFIATNIYIYIYVCVCVAFEKGIWT